MSICSVFVSLIEGNWLAKSSTCNENEIDNRQRGRRFFRVQTFFSILFIQTTDSIRVLRSTCAHSWIFEHLMKCMNCFCGECFSEIITVLGFIFHFFNSSAG